MIGSKRLQFPRLLRGAVFYCKTRLMETVFESIIAEKFSGKERGKLAPHIGVLSHNLTRICSAEEAFTDPKMNVT